MNKGRKKKISKQMIADEMETPRQTITDKLKKIAEKHERTERFLKNSGLTIDEFSALIEFSDFISIVGFDITDIYYVGTILFFYQRFY